jgi:cytochrome c-type biogenesis protein CcmH/NrfG
MFMSSQRRDLETLVCDVEWAFAHGLEAHELVTMLRNLVARATRGSPEAVFSRLKLAELVVSEAPWKAALLARSVVAECHDGHAWAVLGLAQTLLGNYRSAVKAYRHALVLSPASPEIAHNLGHLLDVALDRPQEALNYLKMAHHARPDEGEIVSSYAHALLRAGRRPEARELLAHGLGWDRPRADRQLEVWLVSEETRD